MKNSEQGKKGSVKKATLASFQMAGKKKKKKGETKGLRRKLEAAFKITLHKTPVC